MPPVARVRAMTSGLVSGLFDGDSMSSICLATKDTTFSLCWVTPGTSVVTLCSHCCCSRKACANWLKGGFDHASWAKRRSPGSGAMTGGVSGSMAEDHSHAASRRHLRAALTPSSICLPGAEAR